MGSRRALGGVFVLVLGVGGAFACGDTEPPDVATYGPPNGISGKTPNSPTGATGSSSGGSSGGSSSGGSPTGEDGGTTPPAVTLACVSAGGTIVDGGPCAVSWSQTIYPAMQATGAWGCAATGACHGGTTQPVMTATTPSTFYDALANFTTINSLPYFNPCSTDPTKSTFVCNTSTTGTCGTGVMPLAGGTGAMTDAGLAEIATWVACGAPQN